MTSKLLAAIGLTLAFALPAAAQSTQQPSGFSSLSADQQNTPALQQKIKSDMEQAGFTQVQVMPQSFLVRAHDKQDHPVLMVINPDSVTAVTQMSQASGSAGKQSGNSGGSTKQ